MKEKKSQDERSPILGSWRNVYLLVIIVLLVQMLLYYLFTQHFE